MLVGQFMSFTLTWTIFSLREVFWKSQERIELFQYFRFPIALQISSISKQSINEFHGWRNSISSKLFTNIFEMDFQRKMLLIRPSSIHPVVQKKYFIINCLHFHLIKFWLFRSRQRYMTQSNTEYTRQWIEWRLFPISPFIILFIHTFYTDAFLCYVIIVLCSLFGSVFYHMIVFILQQSHPTMEKWKKKIFGTELFFYILLTKNWERMKTFIHNNICSLFMKSEKLTHDFDPEMFRNSKGIWFAHWMRIISGMLSETQSEDIIHSWILLEWFFN